MINHNRPLSKVVQTDKAQGVTGAEDRNTLKVHEDLKAYGTPQQFTDRVEFQKQSNLYTTYVCPMHPEIKSQAPVACTICGMSLEPEISYSNVSENHELTDFKKRFWIALFLTIPIVFLEMGTHLIEISHLVVGSISTWIQFVLSTFVILWAGWPFFLRGFNSLKQKRLNMFSLISMGTGVAFAYSIVAVLAPSLFPIFFRDHNGHVPVYFESASVIIVLVLLGQILELKARERTGSAIKLLLSLTPKTAKLIINDSDKEVLIEEIKVGDRLHIRPGEKIPVDGVVIEGESYIDESMITGEPIPVSKKQHSFVIAGTVNTNGALVVEAQKVGSDTMLANIVNMVATAQRSRAPIQRLADIISEWFVPIVIIIATISFILWTMFAQDQAFSYGIISAISVLIIACPCALGLATPMSIMVGVGLGAKNGILIKDAESLEILEKVNTLIIDKTGTLTEGHPKLTKIYTQDNNIQETNKLLQLAASLEQNSEHPLAYAITNAAKEQNLELQNVKDFKAINGKGVIGKIKDQQIAFGNKSLMKDLGFSIEKFYMAANEDRASGSTVMFLANELEVIGYIAVNDRVKESALAAIKNLRKMNIEIIMLTGDHEITAKAVATYLGIEKFYADILPDEKHQLVEKYKAKGYIVAVAGDGINDAPALSAANVGIAMGTGTDIAIESSGIIIVKGDLLRLVNAINLSHRVMNNIRQNLFLAFVYNAVCIPIAAGALYPLFGVLLSPVFAAIAMSLSSLSVISNSLRLKLIEFTATSTVT